MRSFFRNLTLVKEKVLEDRDRQLGEFYNNLKKFVDSGKYSSYSKKEGLLSCIDMSDSEASEVLGSTPGSIRVSRRNMSNELYETLGYDFFELLLNGDKDGLEEAKERLDYADNGFSASSFIGRDVTSLVRSEYNRNIGKEEEVTYSLDDCLSEIAFLKDHSLKVIEGEFSLLDFRKVMYLLDILDGKEGTYKNYKYLVDIFK